MQPRLDAQKVAPTAYHAMLALETAVRRSSHLEPSLVELVRLRASQINGCAFCIDMHTKDARGQTARASSASTRSAPGARLRFTRNASAPRWRGRRP